MKSWWTLVSLCVAGIGIFWIVADQASSAREPPPPPFSAPVRSDGQQPSAARGDVPQPTPRGVNPYLWTFEQQRRAVERRLREEPNQYIERFEQQQRDIERRLREEPNPYLRPRYDRNR